MSRHRFEATPNETAVETVFVGKERAYNRRFLQMCSHHLVEPVACTPASGWEKGLVENQFGLVRERFFMSRLREKSHDEPNALLLDQCIVDAKAHRHPEFREQTVWQVVRGRTAELVRYVGRFDGFHAVPGAVSTTCLVRFDNNKYSVAASAVGRPVEIRAYADRIEPRQDGRVVGTHVRCFGRDQTVFNPWHYVPVLAREPGALLDQLTHHVHILEMNGDSYRIKQDKRRQRVVPAPPTSPTDRLRNKRGRMKAPSGEPSCHQP